MATTTLGNKAVGSIVKIKENGNLVDFYVAKHDYESGLNGSGRTLVVRKDVYDKRQWNTSSGLNVWASCHMRYWLNNIYLKMLDPNIQAVLPITTYYYTSGGSVNTVTTRSDAVFLLSLTELGRSESWINVEGSVLPIVSKLKIAYLDGVATSQWTRSPNTNNDEMVHYLASNGGYGIANCPDTHGSRPAFTLPYNLYVGDDGSVFRNTAPSTPASISIPDGINGGTSITVRWASSTDAEGNLSGYIVERSTNGGSSWEKIYQGSATSTSDMVAYGTPSVQYRVKAYDTEGLESGWRTSNNITVISNLAPHDPATLTVPDQPRGGEANVISWKAASDVDGNLSGYELERSTNGGSSYVQVYKGAATSYSDTIPAGTATVRYRVRAYDSMNAYSGYTTSAVKTVINNDPPTAPGSISLGAVVAGQPVTITITAATDPDGTVVNYTYQRSIDGGSWSTIHTGNVLSYQDTVGAEWATVAYRVCATDDDGASGPYVTSQTSTVNAGWLYISGPASDLGRRVAPFTAVIGCGVSGETGITGIMLDITLDGVSVFSGQVDDGTNTEVLIDTRLLYNGSHAIVASASKGDYLPASASFTFTTAAFALPDGGKGVVLENDQGKPEWPMTVAALVQCEGGSLADRLKHMADAMNGAVKIETGSYVGTGLYGANNPNKIAVSGTPIACVIYFNHELPAGQYTYGYGEMWMYKGISQCFPTFRTVTGGILTVAHLASILDFSPGSVTWYATENAYTQFNAKSSGVTYYYTVLCI